MSYDVISIGEPVIDFFPQEMDGELIYKALPGGGAVNVLAEVCAMGESALLMGAVGEDIFGDFLLREIDAAGVEVGGICRTSAKNTGIGFVQLSQDGERSFLHYRDYHVRTSLWSEVGEAAVRDCQIFHFTAVSLVDPEQREDTLRAIRLAKNCRKLVSFDVNYRERMWDDKKSARELFTACIYEADIVKVSEEERDFLCGTSDCDAAAEILSGGMDKLIFISLGARGSFVSYRGGSGFCRSIPVKAKDTTGCGDAFVGAMLANLVPWVKRGSLGAIPYPQMEQIVKMANAAGAICATRFGSLSSMPSRQEVLAFLEKEVVVIIGAGRSGRGYLARQMDGETHQIVFIDEDTELIHRLKQEGGYEIRFFGGTRAPVRIQGYEAYGLHDPAGEQRICQAAYIFICVGEQNLECTAKYLMDVLNQNRLGQTELDRSAIYELPRRRVVIAAENGTKNLEILKSCITDREILLSECLMLCTTEVDSNQKDILSEDMDYLPYNTKCCQSQLPFACFEPCEAYEVLVRRKVYTYNSLSACIAYLGISKGYDDYGQAANDPEIYAATEQLESSLNQAVCRKYVISWEEQERFSAAAKKKFRNTGICDTISRNVRNARRKLGAGDRIAGPAKLMVQYGIDTEVMEWTAAAAFLYGITCEAMEISWILEDEKFELLFGLEDEREKAAFQPFIKAVRNKFQLLSEPAGSSV